MREKLPPVRVDLLALPGITPAAFYSLFEIFDSVGHTWTAVTGQPEVCVGFDVRIVSPDGKPFRCVGGIPVEPHAGFADGALADIVIVTDQVIDPDADPRDLSPEAADWLRAQYASGATVCSVCTGTLLLAAAGLLNGCEASSHWSAAPLFERYFPEIRFRREKLLVVEGEGDRLVTSGGASSWQELCLYLIERFCGREAAIHTAKLFLLGDRGDGQLPFAVMTRPRQHDDAIIGACQNWIAEHYVVSSPVTRMIELSGLPERTFKRRFRRATGYTPIAYVQTLRVEEAKQMFETMELAADAIGRDVGYEDPASFRRIFKRVAGVTPARYRQRVRKFTRLPERPNRKPS